MVGKSKPGFGQVVTISLEELPLALAFGLSGPASAASSEGAEQMSRMGSASLPLADTKPGKNAALQQQPWEA